MMDHSVDHSKHTTEDWINVQESLKQKLILEDCFTWTISSPDMSSVENSRENNLKFIGGVDVSFLKEDPSMACAALVVVDAETLDVVHEEFDVVRLQIPYVPGFLAFREAPILQGLLDKMKQSAHPFYPQLLMVDGNGLLHPRGFGLACHVGVLVDLPAIGVGKNLHHVDGLTQSGVRKFFEAKENSDKDLICLVGKSGRVWGAAIRSTHGSTKPIYVSIGHCISLDSSIKIVKMCCKFRIPEPIRQADIRSRIFIQQFKGLSPMQK
ncbi:putative deoxyribonuclease V [Dioscorea sansibarensis]